jgi:phenylalanyl-tRNA synthetase beta chain
LAILTSGRNYSENWLMPKSLQIFIFKSFVNFYDKLNLETEEVSLEDERFSDALEIKGKTIARLGKVSPKLLKDFDIEQECFYAERN